MADDAEGRGSRFLLLASTFTVLLAGAAGYFLWLLTRPGGDAPPGRAEDAELAEVSLHPVGFASGTPSEERERIDRWMTAVVFPGEPIDRAAASEAEESLVRLGEPALPRLLDALHRLHAEDGFASAKTRARAAVVDRMLFRVRRALPQSPRPRGQPIVGEEPPSVVERRARAWFLWARERSRATAEGR